MNQSSDYATDLTQSSSLSPDHFLVELAKDILGKGVDCRLEVKGFSMAPFIKDGDVLTLVPLEGSSPVSGDVVAFFRPGTEKLTIHRVLREEGDSCWIRGDNALQADGLIPKTSILGQVRRVERNGKRVFLGLGPERFLIALLTRTNLLLPVLRRVWRIFRPIKRVFSS